MGENPCFELESLHAYKKLYRPRAPVNSAQGVGAKIGTSQELAGQPTQPNDEFLVQ